MIDVEESNQSLEEIRRLEDRDYARLEEIRRLEEIKQSDINTNLQYDLQKGIQDFFIFSILVFLKRLRSILPKLFMRINS